MDFNSIINAAKQNVSVPNNQNSTHCKAKLVAPKKTTQEKKLSLGVRKFLEKQKLEEEKKIREAHQRKLELVARRDPKEQKQIEKTLKVIKSSKKLFTGDEEMDKNRKLIMERTITDDYGFENKSSEAIYLRLMEQYNMMPVEDKFEKFMNPKKSKSRSNNKVIAKNDEENGDENHIKTGQRQRVSKYMGETVTNSSKNTASSKPKKCAVPPVNFEQLLKLAEQKQYEDIVIEMPSKKEPDRLLTMKEKRELEEIEALRKSRLNGAIPKIGARLNNALVRKDERSSNLMPISSKVQQVLQSSSKPQLNGNSSKIPPLMSKSCSSSRINVQVDKSQIATTSRQSQKSRDFPPRDLMRSREFPLKDVRRLEEPTRGTKMKISQKRRIEDENSDSEYDSEMDDFIDNDDVGNDYSSEIKKIFGYDKSRYRDEDFDDRAMESDYKTVMREEFLSKKLGLKEDLEDMKMEAEERKRKEEMMKKRRKN